MGVDHDLTRRHWIEASRGLRKELREAIPQGDLKAVHRKRPWRHFRTAGRQLVLLVVCSWGLWHFTHPLIWVPLAVVQGLTFFNGTVLLHEVLHHLVWRSPRPRAERALAAVYAFFTGISPTQFTRWHLDHHASLGSSVEDPKRRHLSPKKNSRLVKLLYFTPALFPIYFAAAAKENATYPDEVRQRITSERSWAIALHLAVAATLYGLGGAGVMLRVHILPLLLAFPPWFAINRLGQHYWIDPRDPARWGTLVKGSPGWDFLFLWSNYHLEHHYFPGVPFYNLRRLQQLLEPFYEAHGMHPVGYGALLWRWLFLNRPPHAEWSRADAAEKEEALPGI